MLINFLSDVEDTRRRQGRRYELVHILTFSIFAVLSGADSYRKIHTFIDTHYDVLNDNFGLNWQKVPAYTTVRNIIRSVPVDSLEKSFRNYSSELTENTEGTEFAAFDGKVLCGRRQMKHHIMFRRRF